LTEKKQIGDFMLRIKPNVKYWFRNRSLNWTQNPVLNQCSD